MTTKITRIEVLSVIAQEQQTCAPVKLTIGYTDPKTNMVKNDRIVIHKCPPVILERLVNLCGYKADMCEEGLVIMCDE